MCLLFHEQQIRNVRMITNLNGEYWQSKEHRLYKCEEVWKWQGSIWKTNNSFILSFCALTSSSIQNSSLNIELFQSLKAFVRNNDYSLQQAELITGKHESKVLHNTKVTWFLVIILDKENCACFGTLLWIQDWQIFTLQSMFIFSCK